MNGNDFRKAESDANGMLATVRAKILESDGSATRLALAVSILFKNPAAFTSFDVKLQQAIIAMAGIGLERVVSGMVEAELMEAGVL